MKITELVKNLTGEKMSEQNALIFLQGKANQNGTCFVRVLPVEKSMIINPGLSGNTKADEHEHWLCEIIVAPAKWNAKARFLTFRVENEETTLQNHVNGNPVYSEFAGRNICVLDMSRTETVINGGDVSQRVVPFCEPLIDVPFGVGDIIVVSPQTLKQNNGEVRDDKITEILVPVEVDITDIFGYMGNQAFEPFLHLLVQKIPVEYGSNIKMAEGHRQYKQYLRYIKGATFLPLKAGCFLTTTAAVITRNNQGYGQSNRPIHVRFKYGGRKHDFYLVREDKDILGYTVGEKWVATPTAFMCKTATDTEVMQELYGYEEVIKNNRNSGKYFRQEGVEGFVFVTEPKKVVLNIGEVVFAQKTKAIANIRLVNGEIALYTASDKVSFMIDVQSHFRVREGDEWKNLEIPVNIREAYLQGNNYLNIKTVIDYATGDKLVMHPMSNFIHATVGFETSKIKPYRFFYTFKNRIIMRITKDQIIPQGNHLLVQIVERPKAAEDEIVEVNLDPNIVEHGIIVSVGEGTASSPMLYKVGQRISFSPYHSGGGEVFINDNEKYVYLDQQYVKGLIEV